MCYSWGRKFGARDYAYQNGSPTPINVRNKSISYPEFES